MFGNGKGQKLGGSSHANDPRRNYFPNRQMPEGKGHLLGSVSGESLKHSPQSVNELRLQKLLHKNAFTPPVSPQQEKLSVTSDSGMIQMIDSEPMFISSLSPPSSPTLPSPPSSPSFPSPPSASPSLPSLSSPSSSSYSTSSPSSQSVSFSTSSTPSSPSSSSPSSSSPSSSSPSSSSPSSSSPSSTSSSSSSFSFYNKPKKQSLAEIRKENLLIRQIFSPLEIEEQHKKWSDSYENVHVDSSKYRASQGLKAKKEEAQDILRNRFLNSKERKEHAFCTMDMLEDRKMERDKESNQFLLNVAKEGKVQGGSTFSSTIGREALILTNKYRATFKLPPLAWSDEIHIVSLKHSEQMGLGQKGFNHDGFQGRVRAIPFRTRATGENLFMTSHGGDEAHVAQQAVEGWIHSPGHQKNLVGKFNNCGIAAYRSRSGAVYVTQILAYR